MPSIEQIKESVRDIAEKYPIKRISLFGSYAKGCANEESDIDILIEFSYSNVSLFLLSEIRDEIKTRLNKEVDLIHYPIEENSLIEIEEVVDIYEQ
ncbi:hypothetical protein SYNTR_2302 [Candidatus Syntrophocurvum alkaliphilum]|uniref:Polymerase nucleotidyl transferase domain-containing protein n=1 Tax=Candidatus Syntrophocurvum alkaliphilum TaxID=2293317 RepID=A0A6I6DFW5_9FIRM|nr:nucleotidyltransferase domain-containing protein [Candidatus Syntrophocurvum alkaliphilum]QGU00896.1 hypothetical protein SYNTR_2302 [Candidatus Syntrophocurvum alkaliphilum]